MTYIWTAIILLVVAPGGVIAWAIYEAKHGGNG